MSFKRECSHRLELEMACSELGMILLILVWLLIELLQPDRLFDRTSLLFIFQHRVNLVRASYIDPIALLQPFGAIDILLKIDFYVSMTKMQDRSLAT
ncbi:MAG: hypothetical protein JGK01_12950 [Microcoleus sp. PH2017_03_ELD_O_A]|uniref:hypothetical protein n=3 Tax=Microcoleus TaxID=44471 RepID=UPI001D5B5028|nr:MULTISPECIES: hypothetical protein [unclassified Microcoleus]MCC3442678.1 hypothetical protein [Microcoleus sp. PH2017_03_ELD_O_A]MCC3464681.1 hypothetical protein [Microcoleus sp. PH2017_06_SFM_O_A]MCC3523367.1 hypothetical protein [Microcoleus sp. PH2017_20_SFW_D_A]MCC3555428.1 hypothetical protein [Microcoleus sp. PH2017_35_SFW_U_B]TAF88519.1 MAG: hypothetical protein EAZ49_16705 [Oscillatoriales cyanobacterium]